MVGLWYSPWRDRGIIRPRESTTRSHETHPSAGLGVARRRSFSPLVLGVLLIWSITGRVRTASFRFSLGSPANLEAPEPSAGTSVLQEFDYVSPSGERVACQLARLLTPFLRSLTVLILEYYRENNAICSMAFLEKWSIEKCKREACLDFFNGFTNFFFPPFRVPLRSIRGMVQNAREKNFKTKG